MMSIKTELELLVLLDQTLLFRVLQAQMHPQMEAAQVAVITATAIAIMDPIQLERPEKLVSLVALLLVLVFCMPYAFNKQE